MPFSEGDRVRLKTPTIEGPINDIVYDKGTKGLAYHVTYTDAEGDEQSRWFAEAQLELIEAAPEPAPVDEPAAPAEEA